MVGMCITVFVFLLGFVYHEAEGNPLEGTIAQTSLALALSGVFAFGFSAFYEDCLVVDVRANDARRAHVHSARGEFFMMLGLLLFVWVPVLSLFALGLNLLGAYGMVLAVAYLVFVWHERKAARTGRA